MRREGEVPTRLRRCVGQGHDPRPVRPRLIPRTSRSAARRPGRDVGSALEVTPLLSHVEEVGGLDGAGDRLRCPQPLERRRIVRRRWWRQVRRHRRAARSRECDLLIGRLSEGAQREPAAWAQQPCVGTQGHRQVRQKEHDEAGEHRIEGVVGELRRFGVPDPHAGICDAASCDVDRGRLHHRKREVDSSDIAGWADRLGGRKQTRTPTAPHVQHAVARAQRRRRDQGSSGRGKESVSDPVVGGGGAVEQAADVGLLGGRVRHSGNDKRIPPGPPALQPAEPVWPTTFPVGPDNATLPGPLGEHPLGGGAVCSTTKHSGAMTCTPQAASARQVADVQRSAERRGEAVERAAERGRGPGRVVSGTRPRCRRARAAGPPRGRGC